MNANIMKMQIYHKIKYDIKCQIRSLLCYREVAKFLKALILRLSFCSIYRMYKSLTNCVPPHQNMGFDRYKDTVNFVKVKISH